MKSLALLAFAAIALHAEVRTVTLKQAIDLALQQNPDLLLARFDEIKQNQAVRVARDPFALKAGIGSGLGWNNGFPMSIDGAAPSVVQGRLSASVYNRPQKFKVAQELENSRGLKHDIQGRREEVVHRVAVAYLDTARLGRLGQVAGRQIAALQQIQQTIAARVAEGRAIPVDELRARVEVEKAKQRAAQFGIEQEIAESSLAMLLGMNSGERAQPTAEPALLGDLPESEERAIALALENSPELKRLQSAIVARGLEVQSHRSARLPRMDLFAQYGLFAKFNNYEDYFRTFQRHNGQVGVSVQMPIFAGPAANALAGQAEAEVARLRVEVNQTRNRTSHETRRAYQQLALSEKGQELAKLTLELAREEVNIALAKFTEGKLSAKELEEMRVAENERWIAFYDAQYRIERARVDLLYQAGTLMAVLR
jgi:outer membrane protein